MSYKVMLTTEGTYPFHNGGVSTWCHTLLGHLCPDFDFYVYSIIMNPFVTQKFTLPENATLIKVPLWGTEEPSEHLDIPFSKVYLAKKRTTSDVIQKQFLPLFMEMMEELLEQEKDPVRLGEVLCQLYQYFQKYDYKLSFKSEDTWEAYKSYVLQLSGQKSSSVPPTGIYSIVNSLGWIYRFMTILNTPIPDVDVTHSAAAAFCGIPCVIAKIQNKTPFLLTEHGVYLREQYLSLSKRKYSSFLSVFFIRMIRSIVGLNYHYAEQVSPVCEYNTRWEQKFGVEKDRISIIYNGIDNTVFHPEENPVKNPYPVIASIARIDPVKDIFTLMRAAAIVKRKIPAVRFIVYGSVTVPEYYKECLELKEKLDLKESFIFAGHTSDVPAVYHKSDIIALTSITEAFPYSVVEAMMSGKAIVSTDVGGIREALGDCGILVQPGDYEAFARGLMTLLENNELRLTLGEEARDRALSKFLVARADHLYSESYMKLIHLSKQAAPVQEGVMIPFEFDPREKQKLHIEKGFMLVSYKLYHEAISQFRQAITLIPDSVAVPAILANIADCYVKLEESDKAKAELEKAEMLTRINNRMRELA